MTEEQIKQLAERYASENYHPYGSETNPQYLIVSEDSFIAGAHSRDEEIKELQKDVHDFEQALACAEDVVDIQRKELKQLRNPWISVKERLPKKRVAGGITFSVSEFILFEIKSERDYLHFGYYDTDKKLFCSMLTNGNMYKIDNVTRWMLIPELNKE